MRKQPQSVEKRRKSKKLAPKESVITPEAEKRMAEYLEGVCGCSGVAAKEAARDVIEFARQIAP